MRCRFEALDASLRGRLACGKYFWCWLEAPRLYGGWTANGEVIKEKSEKNEKK